MTRDLAWATFRSSVYVQLPEGRANVKMGSVAVLLQCLLFFFFVNLYQSQSLFSNSRGHSMPPAPITPSLADLALCSESFRFVLQ